MGFAIDLETGETRDLTDEERALFKQLLDKAMKHTDDAEIHIQPSQGGHDHDGRERNSSEDDE
jgi:hypothetical protein